MEHHLCHRSVVLFYQKVLCFFSGNYNSASAHLTHTSYILFLLLLLLLLCGVVWLLLIVLMIYNKRGNLTILRQKSNWKASPAKTMRNGPRKWSGWEVEVLEKGANCVCVEQKSFSFVRNVCQIFWRLNHREFEFLSCQKGQHQNKCTCASAWGLEECVCARVAESALNFTSDYKLFLWNKYDRAHTLTCTRWVFLFDSLTSTFTITDFSLR